MHVSNIRHFSDKKFILIAFAQLLYGHLDVTDTLFLWTGVEVPVKSNIITVATASTDTKSWCVKWPLLWGMTVV